MGKRIKLTVSLFTCGTCRKSHNNPLTHVCVVPFGKLAGKRTAKPAKKQGGKGGTR